MSEVRTFPSPTPAELGAILRGETAPDHPPGADEDRAEPDPPEPAASDAEAHPSATTEPEGDGDATPGDEASGQDAAGEGTDDQGEGDEPPTLTMRELADKLGVKAAELYDQVRVGLPEGRGDVTLDELKAGYLGHAELEDAKSAHELERAEYQAARDENQLEDLRNRQELQTIMGFVQQLPRELLQQAQAAHTDNLAREGDLLMRARPEWRDPAARQAAAEEHMAVLGEFGISRAEYQTVGSHKLILVCDELCRLRRERAEALEALRKAREATREPAPRTGTRRSTPQGRAQRLTRAATRPGASNEDKSRAVAAVLRGET